MNVKKIIILLFLFIYTFSYSKEIKVGVFDHPPMIGINSEGKPTGIFTDILEYLSTHKDWQITYVQGTFKEHFEGLQNNSIDLLVSFTPSKERMKQFTFNEHPVITTWAQLFSSKGFNISTIRDLDGKRVAGMAKDIHYKMFLEEVKKAGITVQQVLTPSDKKAFEAVRDGDADALVTEYFASTIRKKEFDLNESPIIFYPHPNAFGTIKGNKKAEQLLKDIDAYLKEQSPNPTSHYHQALRKYFGPAISMQMLRFLNKPQSTLQKASLQLQWKHQFEFAGFYAAKELGYYKDIGLDLSFHEYKQDINLIDEVFSGSKTFGLDSSDIIFERLRGKPVVMLANYFKKSPLVIISKPEFKTLKELADKKIMISSKDQKSLSLKQMFWKNNIDLNDINTTKSPFSPEQFINGEVDAMTAYLINEPYQLIKNNTPYNIINPYDYGVDLYDLNIFTSERFFKNNRQLCEKFVEASNRGWRYALQNPMEIIDLIIKKYNTQNKSKEALIYEYEKVKEMMMPTLYDLGSIDQTRIENIANKFIQNGLVDSLDNLPGIIPIVLGKKVQFTFEEQKWLQKNPVINLVGIQDKEPYWINDGKEGLVVDFISEISNIIDTPINIVMTKQEEIKKTLDEREDIHGGSALLDHQSDYEQFLRSNPYYSTPINIYVRNEDLKSIKNTEDLEGKTIAVLDSCNGFKEYANSIKNVKIIYVKTVIEQFNLLKDKKVDAILGYFTYEYIRNKYNYNDCTIAYNTNQLESLHFVIKQNNPQLRSILNKAIDKLTQQQKFSIMKKWTHFSDESSKRLVQQLRFSDEEIEFLKQHQNIKIGVDSNWMPFEHFDENNNFDGMASDYYKYIAKELDLNFQFQTTLPWSNLIDKIYQSKIDLMSLLVKTELRETKMLFTNPLLKLPVMIMGRDDQDFVEGFNDLKNKEVGVVKGYYTDDILKTKYPEIKKVYFNSIKEGIKALSEGKINYFIQELPSLNYVVKQESITNLKILGKTDEKFELCIGVRKDWPQMLSILNKVINIMPESKHSEIYNRWVGIDLRSTFDYTLFWKATGVIIAVFLFILYWNRRLAQEVKVRRETEQRLKLAEHKAKELHKKALHASNAKGDFLANMSHEIRTPMNAIIGMTTLAKNKQNFEEIQPYLNKILVSSNLLLDIINEILDFSKIEAGKIELEKIPFNLHKITNNLQTLFESACNEKGLELKVQIDPNIPKSLIGDPTRIKQVLTNFTSNALKFTKEGTITIDIHIEKHIQIKNKNKYFDYSDSLGVSSHDQYLIYLGVSDTGKGVAKENQEKLFCAFTQEDESTTRRHGGTGLGLSISKKFVELMDGEIGVVSELNKGSTFYALIPFKEALFFNQSKSSLKSLNHVGEATILTLDDNKHDSAILKEMLARYLFKVDHTDKESLALKYIQENKYDLLILDWMLPNISGIELYKQILEDPSISFKPKVIIVSAYDKYDIIQSTKGIKPPYILEKPFTSAELLRAIMETLYNNESSTNGSCSLDIDINRVNFKNQTILLADDNELNQEVAKEILENCNLKVLLANNGQEAYDLFFHSKDEIKLLLMDLQMPVLDGYEASKMIRQQESGKDVPIIALTADAIFGTKEKVLANGMNDYATKPIDPNSLIQTIAKYLSFESKEANENTNTQKADITIYSINIEKEIERIGGNKEVYFNILRKFATNYTRFLEECIKLDTGHEYDKLYMQLHQLKGVVGNIGAHKLFETIKDAETLAKSKKSSYEELIVIESEIQQIIDSIKTALPHSTQKIEKVVFDAALSKKLIEEMISLLESGDSDVEKTIEELQKQQLEAPLEKLLEEIYANVDDFEYQKALHLALQMKEEINDE